MRAGFWKKHGWWLIPLLVIDAALLAWWMQRGRDDSDADLPAPELPVPEHRAADIAPRSGLILGYPTGQEDLLATNRETIYMPTASGRTESAMYGSVRTRQSGKSILSAFHEGIDIAPLERDRRQMPLDRVLAAADGRIAYVNRVAGNSNYGRYVVIVHDDPVGEIYTLYAHLEEVDSRIKPGLGVQRGEELGRMGHSASTGIPITRAHLHFEIGVIKNSHFRSWFRAQKLKPDHGNYHGHNLAGLHPLDAFRRQETQGVFNMQDYLMELPPAFTLLFRSRGTLDYFNRYPSLWSGGSAEGAVVVAVSEGGVITGGRPASPEEEILLAGRNHRVMTVNEEALGRNGLHLIYRRQGEWELGREGERWLEIMRYR